MWVKLTKGYGNIYTLSINIKIEFKCLSTWAKQLLQIFMQDMKHRHRMCWEIKRCTLCLSPSPSLSLSLSLCAYSAWSGHQATITTLYNTRNTYLWGLQLPIVLPAIVACNFYGCFALEGYPVWLSSLLLSCACCNTSAGIFAFPFICVFVCLMSFVCFYAPNQMA